MTQPENTFRPITIIDLTPALVEQTASVLHLGFHDKSDHWPSAWVTLGEALQEVEESLQPGRISRAAIVNNRVVGWIGGQDFGYDNHVWELHPLVVHPDFRGQGIARALVVDLEALVRERGAITLFVGTDDEDYSTTLGGVDLYDNLWKHIQNIRNLKNHPYSFYQKMGFAIVGVLPDANGPGKPDIYMAKRLIPKIS
jgi:aminoglycoside 6'-N-acetyltransferase I